MLHVFANETDWRVAESQEDALKVEMEETGMNREECLEFYDGINSYEQIDDDFVLSIGQEDPLEDKDIPPTSIREDEYRCKATCRVWADHYGRGFLATTEW